MTQKHFFPENNSNDLSQFIVFFTYQPVLI